MQPLLLATPLPDGLAAEGRAVIHYLRTDAAKKERAERAFEFIYAVGQASLTYHFSKPLTTLGVGVVTRRTVEVALSMALKGLRTPLRRVLGGMDESQLLGVADEIEYRLYPDPHREGEA